MLERAEHHIRDLDAQIKAFVQKQPWRHIIELDDTERCQLHKIKFTERISNDLGHITFDCVNNLRSALDQLGFAIAVKYTGDPNPSKCKFPFSSKPSEFANHIKGACKQLPPEIQSLFASLQPYKGGNNTLWGINELANGSKHKILVPVEIGSPRLSFYAHEIPKGVEVPDLRYDSDKHEFIFAKVPNGIEFKYNAHFTFGVAIEAADDVIRGQSPIALLLAMTDEVARILSETEKVCRSINLIPLA